MDWPGGTRDFRLSKALWMYVLAQAFLQLGGWSRWGMVICMEAAAWPQGYISFSFNT